MAEQSQNPGAVTNTFTKGMVKDYNDTFVGEGLWTHARNAVNNSHDGQVGVIGNEPSNLLCITLPYTLIGSIHLQDDQWAVFTTNDIDSEIGVFDESACTYTKIVNDKCLNFKRSNLITGVYRQKYNCGRLIYWDDGLNPSRFMDIDDPTTWKKYTETLVNGCSVKTYLNELNCEAIRLAPLIKHPCITLEKSKLGGALPNGSYQACIAYTIAGVKVTDYLGLSEVQSLFRHENVSSALEVKITSIDDRFDEFQLVILSNINNQSTAKIIGVYSTSVGTIMVDRWSTEYKTVPVGEVVYRKEPVEKSDAMYAVNNYLLRVGVTSKFKFNYQIQANNIKANWVAIQYPADYYHKGGNNTGYMRDEQYAFFIRWVYNTGERSESYHIPGRASLPADRDLIFGGDAFETTGSTPVTRERWQVENTAIIGNITSYTLADGGRVIATGEMGYWESSENYPDSRPDIWGNLCGKPIRHHKMPDVTIQGGNLINHFAAGGASINILGVQFSNITHPLDNNGQPIQSIVGYEILRGSREGNKSVIAKGLLNNMRVYPIPGTSIKGLYQNYPYNSLAPDNYLTSDKTLAYRGQLSDDKTKGQLTEYSKNIFSFHSPETTFSNPFLNVQEVKVYEEVSGTVTGKFVEPYKHPKLKVPSDFLGKITTVLAIIDAINTAQALYSAQGGIEIAATEKFPINLKYNWPKLPETPGGLAGVPVYAASLILYGVTVAAMLLLERELADVREEKLISLFVALIPRKQYALQYISSGFYNNYKPNAVGSGEVRRKLLDSNYIRSSVHGFTSDYRVNNLYRSGFVILKTDKDIKEPSTVDNTRFLYHDKSISINDETTSTTSAYYGAIKIPMESQYGQLDSVKQFPISYCVNGTLPVAGTKYSSEVLFGGDTYINRFTERNTMFFFNTWMMGEPDETEFDYRNYFGVAYPRYWLNSQEISGDILRNMAFDRRHLNGLPVQGITYYVKNRHFYLFNSGVRDFFVESEINVGYRDWDDQIEKRFFDPYGYQDIDMMFRSDIIKSGEIYKYDYSLSLSKLVGSHISWGNILPRDYDPKVAEKCYVYTPNRVVYSLPQQLESRKDNWRIYLANNYKEFLSPVTSIKPIAKTGALFMMKRQSPLMFMGVEQLKMDVTGAKVTIGDGQLFDDSGNSKQLQALVNTDESFEYGSNQNRLATLNTPYGVFWASQDQGKIFQYSGELRDISKNGLKWWFAQYLPSELLKVYPNYPLYDNPVKGIGVQMTYDNTNEILYISKKDYKPKRRDLLFDAGGFYYLGPTTSTISTCPAGYTLQGNVCVSNTPSCPIGFQLVNGQCVKTETVDPIQSGSVVPVTRTPYEVYGNFGTRVYNNSTTSSTFTLLNTSNTFWIRQASPSNWNSLTPAQKQAYDLNNGPVNRLSIWGNPNGLNLNNYNHAGSDLLPVSQWIGFDVCINIVTTKTYYVAIAADNEYRFSLDGNLILSDTSGTTTTFNFLHIYPVTITAGSHILRLEGRNNGQKAGFGCEVFDLDNRPSGTSVVDFLNGQTSYDNLNVIFTTRNVTQFSSNLFSCPAGYGLANPTCNQPVCQKITTTAPTNATTSPTVVTVREKIYCNFEDSRCWENASWTMSYDPKNETWISYHDWIPTYLLPGKAHFMSVNGNTIWKHNVRCDSYTNFYGIDYPFEVEFISSTGQQVASMRNIEYLLEAYKTHNECRDKFHVLDANFDQAIIYNSEQISGLLELELKSKTNPVALLSYPQVRPQSIGINFSKEENKYRFNQFWDITKNRGEFTSTLNIPMFLTRANGYQFDINPAYVNYNKSPLERKKFRHHVGKVFLRKLRSNDVKYMFKISNQKVQQSPR